MALAGRKGFINSTLLYCYLHPGKIHKNYPLAQRVPLGQMGSHLFLQEAKQQTTSPYPAVMPDLNLPILKNT
jgi:hypothetical protein